MPSYTRVSSSIPGKSDIVSQESAVGLFKKELSFLDQAVVVSRNSKDENTQVGAVIVDAKGRVASVGYNGAVAGTNDDRIPYSREEKELWLDVDYVKACPVVFDDYKPDLWLRSATGLHDSFKFTANKYPFMLHAEQNAILHCSELDRLIGGTIYVTAYPCSVCANLLSQKQISKVVVLNKSVQSVPPELLIHTLYILQQNKIELVTYTLLY